MRITYSRKVFIIIPLTPTLRDRCPLLHVSVDRPGGLDSPISAQTRSRESAREGSLARCKEALSAWRPTR